MKFLVSKNYRDAIGKQLAAFEREGTISEDQRHKMMDAYEVTKGVNLIRLISVVGSVLVGLGILTYIAGNWQNLSPFMRMGLIVTGMIGFYVMGMQLDNAYPKTARALRYIALFIFGGGLFLTDQTFHLDRNVAFHFLIWSVGVLAALQFEKDVLLLHFFQILIVASSMSLFESQRMAHTEFLAYYVVVLAGLFLSIRLSDKVYRTGFSAFLSVAGIFFSLMTVLIHFEVKGVFGCWLMLAVGLALMLKSPIGKHAEGVMQQTGLLIAGFSGFFLTFADTWGELISSGENAVAIVFTIVMLLGLFYLVRKDYVGAIGFIALIIMRYYFDTFYDFMPKSLFFVIGGGLLIGFGVYLESVRRKGLKKNA